MRTVLAVAATVLLAAPVSAGLIVNGDFQLGNQDFQTDYIFSPGNIGPQRTYDVLANPFPAHPSAHSYFDHTLNTALGRMMAVNEANAAGVLVWGQTVSVVANSDYVFAAFLSSSVAAAPTKLDVLFNGTSIGVMQAPSTTGTWVQFAANWNSGSASSAVIELRNVVGADVGGDFALDDLSLDGPDPSAVPEPSALALLAIGRDSVFCAAPPPTRSGLCRAGASARRRPRSHRQAHQHHSLGSERYRSEAGKARRCSPVEPLAGVCAGDVFADKSRFRRSTHRCLHP